MNHHDDFAALRNLLALKRLDTPMDTEVNRFLIEFHRRQRAQLLVPESRWSRAAAWLKEGAARLGMVPSLSYASAVAAIALAAFLGLSQQVQVTEVAGQYKFSLLSPSHEASLAMIPASFGATSLVAKKASEPTTFGATRADATTRFVLANTHPGYDATATF
jgi:IS5 family transposase